MRGARLDFQTNFVLGSTRECERLRECCAKLLPKINISHSFDSPKSTEAKNRNMWKRFHLLDAHWIRTIYASSCHHMACRRSGDEKKNLLDIPKGEQHSSHYRQLKLIPNWLIGFCSRLEEASDRNFCFKAWKSVHTTWKQNKFLAKVKFGEVLFLNLRRTKN